MARDPRLRLSRSWTTRPRRPTESDADYNFVDRAAFLAHLERGGFLEWNELATSGHLYGTPLSEAEDPDHDVLLVIEVNGAEQVLAKVPDALMILVQPPSDDALRDRMRKRGDDPAEIEARVALGRQEVEKGRRLTPNVVVNDDLARCTDEVARILERHRSSSS